MIGVGLLNGLETVVMVGSAVAFTGSGRVLDEEGLAVKVGSDGTAEVVTGFGEGEFSTSCGTEQAVSKYISQVQWKRQV